MDISKLNNSKKHIKHFPSQSSVEHKVGRQFHGPNEKKQFYIGKFISQLAESDPQSKHLSKVDLIETKAALCKSIGKNPQLFKLIQTIVDDCAFLDDDVLGMMESEDCEEIPNCSQDLIDQKSKELNKQRWLMQLTHFNAVQMSNPKVTVKKEDDELSTQTKSPNEIVICKSIHRKMNEDYGRSIVSKPINTMGIEKMFSSSISKIGRHMRHFDHMMSDFEVLFKRQLIDTDQMMALCLYAEQQNQQSLSKLFDQDRNSKIKLLLLHFMLREFCDYLSGFEKQIFAFFTRQKIESDLNSIKDIQDAVYQEIINTNSESKHEMDDLKMRILEFIYKNETHLKAGPLIAILHSLQNNIIFLECK